MRTRRLLQGLADAAWRAAGAEACPGAGPGPRGLATACCSSARPFSTGVPAQLARGQGNLPQLSKASRPGVLRPVGFCVGVSAAAFTAAALLEDDSYRHAWDRLRARAALGSDLPAWLQGSPRVLQNLYREFWGERTRQERVLGGLLAANGAVFLLLRRSPPGGFMFRNFVQTLPPQPLRTATLLTSNFSHMSAMHLGFNMLALWSFGREAAALLGAEQFAAFFVSAGLASALASQLGRRARGGGGYSLGASGAVYACFALTALTRPDAEVVLVFLPFLPIRVGDALAAAMTLDAAGALLGWRRFDHFGHLGGALFGLYWVLRGQRDLWPRFQQAAASLRERWDGARR